jgi:hypothetical protein
MTPRIDAIITDRREVGEKVTSSVRAAPSEGARTSVEKRISTNCRLVSKLVGKQTVDINQQYRWF